jgi:hypothetical protein
LAGHLPTVFYVVALLAVYIYVLAPVVVYWKFRLRAYADWQVVPPEELPSEVRDYIAATAPALSAEGFSLYLTVSQTEMVRGVRAYSAWWTNTDRGQCAACSVLIPSLGKAHYLVEFETITVSPFTTVSTMNFSGSPGVFDRVARKQVRYFPWVQDVGELYRIHLYRERSAIAPDAVRWMPSPDPQRAIDQQKNVAAFGMREQERLGLFFETEEAGVFRPTWYGAYLTVMRFLPPGKQVRRWKNRRAAEQDARLVAAQTIEPPIGVAVTTVSPFEPPLSVDLLTYA